MVTASEYLCDVYADSAMVYETFSGIAGASTLGVGVVAATGSPVETCWCFSWPPQAAMAAMAAMARASVAVAAIVGRGRYIYGPLGWGCAPLQSKREPI